MRIGETNSYVAPSTIPEKKGCGYACLRICALIRSVLCCKGGTSVHPYAPATLNTNKVEVKRNSDDPLENMLNVKVVQAGWERAQDQLQGSARLEQGTGDV